MNCAMDGHLPDGQVGARPRRLRRIIGIGRGSAGLLILAALFQTVSAVDVLGQSASQTVVVFASARVVANRSINVVEDRPVARLEGTAALANRPASITLGDLELPWLPESMGTTDGRSVEPNVSPASGPPTQPQDEPRSSKSGDGFIGNVQTLGRDTKTITLSDKESVAIDLGDAIDSAEILEPDNEVARVGATSRRQVVVRGLSVGQAQLHLRSGETEHVVQIRVERDLSALIELIRSVAPTSDVKAQSLKGTIVLSGRVRDGVTAQRIVDLAKLVQGGEVQNHLRVAGVQQTMLRVVVAEVNKQAIRRLGVNWAFGASKISRDFFFANNLNQINPTVFASAGLADVANFRTPANAGLPLRGQQLFSVAGVGNGPNTNVTFGFPRTEFQMFVNALRENRLFRVMAEPNLVALTGQTATFLAGGEVPVPVTQGGAVAGAIVIEYKEFGVRLAFTPTLLGGQRMRIHVMTEVSDAVPGPQIVGGLPVFSFTTRRVESTVECGNGQTFAIAGLLRETVRGVASKIPWLGDIPVLGSLFSSVDYQRDDTELVVLVTPQLVEPLDPQQVVPPPGSLMTHPDDYQLFANQKLEGVPHSAPSLSPVPRDTRPVNVWPDGASWPTTQSQLALRGPWGVEGYQE